LNSTAGSYSGLDAIDVTAQTGISAAEYDWGQFAATVTINGLQEAQNNSTEQIIDLLESKIFQTQESIIESMNTMFFANGTGNGGKDWNGLTTSLTIRRLQVTHLEALTLLLQVPITIGGQANTTHKVEL
jgi:hypothetical protein